MRIQVFAFIYCALTLFLESPAWAANRPQIQISQGLIQVFQDGKRVAEASVSDIKTVIREEPQLIAAPLMPSDDLEVLRLINLENRWLKSKIYVQIGKSLYELSIAEHQDLIRQKAHLELGNPPPVSTPADHDQVEHFLETKIRQPIRAKAREISRILNNPSLQKQVQRETLQLSQMISNAITEGNVGMIAVINGRSYALGNLGGSIAARLTGNILEMNSESRNLECDFARPQASGFPVQLKIDGSYARVSMISYNPATKTIFVDTAQAGHCQPGLFNDSFE